MTRSRWMGTPARAAAIVLVVMCAQLAAAPVLAASCIGDCNGDGVVKAGELTSIVARVLVCNGQPMGACGSVAAPDCVSADKNGDGTISAGEFTNAIANALVGCVPAQTPTPETTATATSAPSPSTTRTPSRTLTPTTTATQTPAGNCGNGFLDRGDTCVTCPADCTPHSCTATTPLRTFTVNFAPPAGQEPTSVTALVGYRSERVSLPGSGSAASSRVKNRPTNAIVATNDLDYALRVVITRSSSSPVPAGRLFTVDFDSCQGATAPTAADFGCTIEGCASSFGTIDGCTCTVTGP